MQHDAAQYLHIERAHADHALGRLARNGKCVGQQVVQGSALVQAFTQDAGLRAQRVVAHDADAIFMCVDLFQQRRQFFNIPFSAGAK